MYLLYKILIHFIIVIILLLQNMFIQHREDINELIKLGIVANYEKVDS